MPYEPDMMLVFDAVDGSLIVGFRDAIEMLGPFNSQRDAIRAGEQFCRERGWDDAENDSSANAPVKPRMSN